MKKRIVNCDQWFKEMQESFLEGRGLEGYVVFSNKNVEKGIWRNYPGSNDGSWPLEERTYVVHNSCKYFNPAMGGTSIFASNLAGSDYCKLSDLWLHSGAENWIEEEFYFLEEK